MPLGTSSAVPRQKHTILVFVILNLVVLSTIWSLSIPRASQGVSFDLAQETAAASQAAPIVFALVMFGAASATEGAIAIKSALMHASRPVDLHIITSEDAIPVLEAKMRLVKRPAYPIRMFYYPLDAASIRKRAARAGVETRYEAGVGGLVKIFIHEVLPNTVPKAIFFDTDMLFVTDPYLLWRQFDKFQGSQIISFPDLGSNSTAMDICTCTMLLNLDAMRSTSTPFVGSELFGDRQRPLGTLEVFRKHGVNPRNPQFGDQGLYWAIWKEYPERFRHLPLAWDTSHCRFSYGMTLDGDDSISEEDHIKSQIQTYAVKEDFEQLFPGILHFNCQNKFDVVWDAPENKSRKRWASFVTLSLDYKWVWLNKGDGSVVVESTVVSDTVFWDQRSRRSHPHTAIH